MTSRFREHDEFRCGCGDGRCRHLGRDSSGILSRLATAVCAVFLVLPMAVSHAQNAGEIVRAIQRNYDAARDYQADFRQTTVYRTLNRQIEGRGSVYVGKSAKMLWRYEEPAGQFVLSDGRDLYFYQPTERQIIKTALGSVFRSDLPLSFLLGVGNLERDFQADLVASAKGVHLLTLSPRKANTGVSEIQIAVESGSHDITRVFIEDAAGNGWTFHFDNFQRGVVLDATLFELKVPQGVDIVEFGS